MNTRKFELTIIIVNWNTRDLLQQCLQSCYPLLGELDCEIVVVDNASSDGSAEMVRARFPDVHLFVNRANLGFARANNQAMTVSESRYVLLLNSDTVVLPGEIQKLIAFMNSHPQVGAVGPQLLNPDGSVQPSYGPKPSFYQMFIDLTGLSSMNQKDYAQPSRPQVTGGVQSVGWLQGACLMMRREAISQIGLLDEGYFMYTEEVDWCYRAQKAGWSLYHLPEARVIHLGGQSAAQQPTQKRQQLYRSKLLFVRKHRGWVQYVALRLVTKVSACLKLVLAFIRFLSSTQQNRERAEEAIHSYYFVLREV